MSQTVILSTLSHRASAKQLIDAAPERAVCRISPPKRSIDQNDKMWAMLSDISRAKPEGRTYTPEVWKALFMHSLGHQVRFEMALDGNGPVPIGFHSSRMTVAEMADLITMIDEYAARHGVELGGSEND